MSTASKPKPRKSVRRAQRKLAQAIWTEAFIEYWNSLPDDKRDAGTAHA